MMDASSMIKEHMANAPCNGFSCPSAQNCQRYTDWATFHGSPSAFWARREEGADSCESMVPVVNMSTFKE